MRKSILLVEDHPDSAGVFARMLQKTGYDVAIAVSMADARQALSRKSFDLLICDIELPDGKGTNLLQDARSHSPQIAAIVVSGHEDPGHRTEARDAGFAEYFVKPVDFPGICCTIESLIGK
jgi:DNA-binding NtrC family response regulator